jgi:hypothetical protein
LGPVSPKEIMSLYLEDKLNMESYVMDSRSPQWIKIKDISQLVKYMHESDIHLSYDEKDIDSVLNEDEHAPIFFHYPTSKFIILSIISFGAFELYWFFRNWEFLRFYRKGKTSHNFFRDVINPFAIIRVFYNISSDKELVKYGGRGDYSVNGVLWLMSFIILSVFSLLTGFAPRTLSELIEVFTTLAVLGFSIWCLLPVQKYIDKANTVAQREFSKTGFGLYVIVAFGATGWITLLGQLVRSLIRIF